ncbi:MAG TPA: hypothetical protein VJJ22_04330 [Candidatus Paceibacterota bacterium]
MKKVLTISILIILFTGGFLIFYQSRPAEQKVPVTSEEARIDDQASVTVTITPFDISSQSKEWKFDVAMDTHSVELDQDMVKVSVLVDDNGKEYKPLRWEGAEVGGHHREGVLTFSQIIPFSQSVELKISSIGDVIRSFV